MLSCQLSVELATALAGGLRITSATGAERYRNAGGALPSPAGGGARRYTGRARRWVAIQGFEIPGYVRAPYGREPTSRRRGVAWLIADSSQLIAET